MTDRTKSDTDMIMVPQHRPIADGREFRAMVTIETAERLAAKAVRALNYSAPFRDLPMIKGATEFLRELCGVTSERTATEVKTQADSDAIAEAAFTRCREISERVEKPVLVKLPEFSWIPNSFEIRDGNPENQQQAIRTPVGDAVITPMPDGVFEIETSFTGDQIGLYYDTLSADAAMARLYGLATAHTAKAEEGL